MQSDTRSSDMRLVVDGGGGKQLAAVANGERYAAITGWGRYVPERVLTNADLMKLVATDDEWIVSRTGIRERRIAAPDETTATMATAAASEKARWHLFDVVNRRNVNLLYPILEWE